MSGVRIGRSSAQTPPASAVNNRVAIRNAFIKKPRSLPPHQPGDLFCPIVHDNSVTANYFESLGIVDGLYAARASFLVQLRTAVS